MLYINCIFILCFIGYSDCQQLASPADNSLSTTFLIHGTEVTLVIKYGYTALSETKSKCQDGGVLSHILAGSREGMSCIKTFEIM